MNNLASVLKCQNRIELSVELYKEVLKFRRDNLLSNDPRVGDSMNSLAEVYFRINRLN